MSILDRFVANSTQLTGLLAFAAAAIACWIASIACRHAGRRDARTWNVLALTNFLLFIEIYIGLRHRVTWIVVTLLKSDHLYTRWHGSIQERIIISIAAMALIFAAIILLRRQVSGCAARFATGIMIALVALFAIETVSLHAIDAVFYRRIGPIMTIGWIWAVASMAVCLTAVLDWRK